jgi:hypothetical protein
LDPTTIKGAFLSAPISYSQLDAPILNWNGNLNGDNSGYEGESVSPVAKFARRGGMINGAFNKPVLEKSLLKFADQMEKAPQVSDFTPGFKFADLIDGEDDISPSELPVLEDSVRGLMDRYHESDHGGLPSQNSWDYCLEPSKIDYPKGKYADEVTSKFCYGKPNDNVGINYVNIFLPKTGDLTVSLPADANSFMLYYFDQLNHVHCKSVNVDKTSTPPKISQKDDHCS